LDVEELLLLSERDDKLEGWDFVVDGVTDELGALVEGTWVVDGVAVGVPMLAGEDDSDVADVHEEDGLVVDGVGPGNDVVEDISDVEDELEEGTLLVGGVADDGG